MMKEGLRPFYKVVPSQKEWERIPGQLYNINDESRGINSSFSFQFLEGMQHVYFAYSFPWSYLENEIFFDSLIAGAASNPQIYAKKEILTYSNEGREVTLLTLTSQKGRLDHREPDLPGLFSRHPLYKRKPKIMFDGPKLGHLDDSMYLEYQRKYGFGKESSEGQEDNLRAHKFEGKKYIFLTSRVHPGETPASHMLNGLVSYLFSDPTRDFRVKLLLDNFVFVVIPMLNPDGVFRGHYRQDTIGNNLNRKYLDCDQHKEPTV